MQKLLNNIHFRNLVQIAFVLISLYIGWHFISFYNYLESGSSTGVFLRPPGVEAFTPLSSLVGLKVFLTTGIFDYVHPAGLVVLISALLISFLFRKSFCSWICPFGFIEEIIGKLGAKIMHRRLNVPKWLDIPLRSLKFILLAFFVYSIFFVMDSQSAVSFLESPYNKVADLKMLKFFLNISATGTAVFGFLIVMSFFVNNFWCRYLCPYGALLGLAGWLSPSRITRSEEKCINCGACDKACPSRLAVSTDKKVVSPECNGCLECIDKCPVDRALTYNFAGKPSRYKYLLPAVMLCLFALIIVTAKLTGFWQSSVTLREVMLLFPLLDQI